MHFFIFMLHFWAVIIKTTCPYTNYVKNKTKMFIFNLFSSAFLIFNFLRFLPCILLQRLFYYGSEAIEWFILLNYCVNPFDFSLETYLDLVLTQKNRTKLSFIQCTVPPLLFWTMLKKNCKVASLLFDICHGVFNQVVDQSLCRVCRSIEQGSAALRNSIRWTSFLNFFLPYAWRHFQNIWYYERTSPNYIISTWTNVECTQLSLTQPNTFENFCNFCPFLWSNIL